MKKDDGMKKMAERILSEAKKEKKIIRLHYLPDAIKKSVNDLKEMSEDEGMRNLFEDIGILLEWALARLPIVPPPTEKEDKQLS